jgi:hypothetical protein
MGKLSGKKVDETPQKEKPKPVKAGWNFKDNVGGIFQKKVVAIWKKIFG